MELERARRIQRRIEGGDLLSERPVLDQQVRSFQRDPQSAKRLLSAGSAPLPGHRADEDDPFAPENEGESPAPKN